MKNKIITLPCEPGDKIYIKAQDAEAMVIRIEITKIGTKIIATNKKDTWEFWDIQADKDFEVKK